MKLAGFLLLLAGWGIVLTALVLFTVGAAQASFIVAGIGVEIVGLVLVGRGHPLPRGERG